MATFKLNHCACMTALMKVDEGIQPMKLSIRIKISVDPISSDGSIDKSDLENM